MGGSAALPPPPRGSEAGDSLPQGLEAEPGLVAWGEAAAAAASCSALQSLALQTNQPTNKQCWGACCLWLQNIASCNGCTVVRKSCQTAPVHVYLKVSQHSYA